jgi:hypothetical protein
MINPTSAALLSVIGHGGVAELHKSGLNPAWVQEPEVRLVVEMSLSLHLQGQGVSFPSVMIRLKEIAEWEPIAHAWQDGYGSTPREAVERLKEDAMRREAILLQAEIGKNIASKKSPSQWLPGMVGRLTDVVRSTSSYNPSPSSHMTKPLPEVLAPFPDCHGLNEIFRGGVWRGATVGISALSGGGKTTMTTTMASRAVIGRMKTVVLSSQMPEQYVTAKVIQSWGIPWEGVLALRTGKDSIYEEEHRQNYEGYLEYADKYLLVYGSKFMSLQDIKQIVELNHPDLVIIDHLMAVRRNQRGAQSDASAIGELAYGLEDIAVVNQTMMVFTSQLTGDDADKFRKHHDLPSFRGFGTAQVEHVVRLGALMCRHWDLPNVEFIKVKKDSLTGNVETEHSLVFSKEWGVYVDAPQRFT